MEKENAMATVIIGGTRGLGFEIGVLLAKRGSRVFTTGRSQRAIEGFTTVELPVNEKVAELQARLDTIVSELPHIDLLVFAAGFGEQGTIDELSDEHVLAMINVGLVLPALLLQRILKKQGGLKGLIAITSTSQWIPRKKEPVYTGVKAGLAMLANSVSLDSRAKKTLVVGPAGMDTGFWAGSCRDTAGMLSPQFVAKEVFKLWNEKFVYRLARILRDPPRVEVLEAR